MNSSSNCRIKNSNHTARFLARTAKFYSYNFLVRTGFRSALFGATFVPFYYLGNLGYQNQTEEICEKYIFRFNNFKRTGDFMYVDPEQKLFNTFLEMQRSMTM